jgi:hypothetical protein
MHNRDQHSNMKILHLPHVSTKKHETENEGRQRKGTITTHSKTNPHSPSSDLHQLPSIQQLKALPSNTYADRQTLTDPSSQTNDHDRNEKKDEDEDDLS